MKTEGYIQCTVMRYVDFTLDISCAKIDVKVRVKIDSRIALIVVNCNHEYIVPILSSCVHICPRRGQYIPLFCCYRVRRELQ
jgi:hypothetical protein